jgi:fatty-acyl-CoA synthase
VAAVVVPSVDALPAPEALQQHCRERLARHKAPVRWYFADALPLTPSGKVQKFRLREMVERGEIATDPGTVA